MSYKRKLSPIERLYVCCDKRTAPYETPCINQMILEGRGSIDETAWKNAVKQASLANPGSRVILKGKLGFARWIDSGKSTEFRVVEGGGWDGRSEVNAPFLSDPLPPYQGPTSEVVLVKCEKYSYVIFRSHHAAMDGRGTQAFADDVFRVLNGDSPLGENSIITDLELSRKITSERSNIESEEVRAPTGLPDGRERGRTWYRKTVTGKFSQVLAKVAISIAHGAWQHGETKVRFRLPVDMRPRIEGIRSTANLSGALMMEITKNTTTTSWKESLKEKLANKREAIIPQISKHIPIPIDILRWISLNVLQKGNIRSLEKRITSGFYQASGSLSNLGLLPLSNYHGGGFSAHRIFFIPPEFDSSPLFLTLTGNENGIELVLSLPKVLATNGRLHDMLSAIVESLSDARTSPTGLPMAHA